MRLLRALFVVLVGSILPVTLAHAQGAGPVSKTSDSGAATKQEVNELRSEVAAQRQTIEELKALVEKLAAAKTVGNGTAEIHPVAETAPPQIDEQPVNMRMNAPVHLSDAVMRTTDADPMPAAVIDQAPTAAPKKDAPLAAGWNGEHFFIRSADGLFSISPYGYVNTDYRAYKGDGAPSDTFLLRNARFGFQGNYGSHLDFALLTDAAATSGSVVRDVYLNVRYRPELQFQAGQFKAPFAQETGIGDTNLDFVERGFQSMLYPSAASAYRSPGIALHGDIAGGVVQYWAGAFNGKGYAIANTTNQEEIIGRLRIYPGRRSKNDWFKQLAFGGSIDRGRSRGLSGDQSFSGALPDGAYTFFPQFAINGPIWRYNGEFTYIKSSFGLRGEYDQINQYRENVGSEQAGGLGFLSLPGIIAKAWDIGATYLITGEKRPENGTPRVRRPSFGPDTPGGKGHGLGAWEVAFRFTGIQSNEPGANFLNYYTPGYVPTFNYHTFEYTAGLNYYPNYWVKYQVNVSLDQLKDPSVIGTVPQNFYVIEQRLQFRF
ncbi:MAG TPA: porin [Candidatus Aquilonibacter sp.]|jgi:phosphate-selective porin|nr:porin [Candidatus Aquilonibacter sp.]